MRPEIQEEAEMEMLLNEIPGMTSPTHHHHHVRAGEDHAHQMQQMLPAHGMYGHASNDDDPSSSHGLLNGHGRGAGHACQSPPPRASVESSPSSLSGILSPADDGSRRSSAGEDCTMECTGLLAGLRLLSIGDDREAQLILPSAPATNPLLFRSSYGNSLVLSGASDDVYGAPWYSALPNHAPFDPLCGSGSQQHYRFGVPAASHVYGLHTALENFICSGEAAADGALGPKVQGLGFPSAFLHSPHDGVDLGRDLDALNSLSPLHAMLPKQDYNLPYSRAPPQLDYRMCLRGIPAANVDGVHDVPSPKLGRSPRSPLNYDNMMGIEGYMYYIAKDQQGCRFLQRKFDEGRHQVDVIFNGIIGHIVELMVDPFGNYLVQKLLDVCSEEQRTTIILMLTEELVRISLNIHGTRAVQKLIETLKTRQQIALVISALQPGYLNLIKDLNGYHVVQRCLRTFAAEDNKYIFDAAAKHCVDIATHQHGCCVLQRCISHSTGEHRRRLIAEISANGLELAQDNFGNYVVQYILDLKNPLVIANLASQFKGYYAQLSMQKFSSHVVEKCLMVFGEVHKATIIFELLSVSQFEQLLQDPYANYVIQSALQNTKGYLHAMLMQAIRPHASILRTNPYCKRIFSRAPLKRRC